MADLRYRQFPGHSVALDWMAALRFPLSQSWTITRTQTYTFQLRDDVSFAAAEVHPAESSTSSSGSRIRDQAPYAGRRRHQELRAPDPYTVDTFEEPTPNLLRSSLFTTVIHNKERRGGAGQVIAGQGRAAPDPGVSTAAPRTEIFSSATCYRGALRVQEQWPGKFEKLSMKIMPEESSRVAAMMAGQFDMTHQFPPAFIAQAKAAPMLTVTAAKPNFQLLYFGFKTTRPMVEDRRVREAMSIAINRGEIAKAILLGNAEPAFTIVDPDALDHDAGTKAS